MMPLRFGIAWADAPYTVFVSVYANDGTVAVAHGGVEVGQGINTKVQYVCTAPSFSDFTIITAVVNCMRLKENKKIIQYFLSICGTVTYLRDIKMLISNISFRPFIYQNFFSQCIDVVKF